MSFNINNDNLVLVAPRPVRLADGFTSSSFASRAGAAAFRVLSTAPSDALEYMKLADESQETKEQHPSRPVTASPRPSPRSSLQSDALEEFLSILRPATFFYPPNTSPILRARRNNGAIPAIPHERSHHPYKRDRSENGKFSDSPSPSRNNICATPFKNWSPEEKREIAADAFDQWYPFRTYDILSSPINRAQARNPFNRYNSDQQIGKITAQTTESIASSSPLISPSLAASSPAAIPLPSPGPEEAMELDFTS